MNLALISELKPRDLDSLTEEQETLLKLLREQLIDFNADRLETLEWADRADIRVLVGAYANKVMTAEVDAYYKNRKPRPNAESKRELTEEEIEEMENRIANIVAIHEHEGVTPSLLAQELCRECTRGNITTDEAIKIIIESDPI